MIEQKNAYEGLKKQYNLKDQDLETLIVLEQKLRKELNRNLNQDFNLKNQVNRNASIVDDYQRNLQQKDATINRLQNELKV